VTACWVLPLLTLRPAGLVQIMRAAVASRPSSCARRPRRPQWHHARAGLRQGPARWSAGSPASATTAGRPPGGSPPGAFPPRSGGLVVAAESPTHPRRRHHPETGLALIGPATRPSVPAWLPL